MRETSFEDDGKNTMGTVADFFVWIYWYLNRPFLIRFAEAVNGYHEGLLSPNGRKIIKSVEADLLRRVPRPVFRQLVATVFTLPIAVPPSYPRSDLARLFVKLWFVSRSHWARLWFIFKSEAGRTAHLKVMFDRLVEHAAEQEDDAIKTVVTLSLFKGVLSAAHIDMPDSWKAINYDPTPKRGWEPPSGPNLESPPRMPTNTKLVEAQKTLAEVAGQKVKYCIIGSGAGGGIVARSIQEKDPGASMMMLEAGSVVSNTDYVQRLLPNVAQYYMNAGATLSKDQMFYFRQGRGVGGSTLVNNAVALMPDGFWWDTNIVARWKEIGVELDYPRLLECYGEVMAIIKGGPLDERVISKAGHTVREAFAKSTEFKIILDTANLEKCIGCGRCNLGCQYGAKQGMAENVIPQFIDNGGLLVPNAKVTEINWTDHSRSAVESVSVVDEITGRSHKIRAEKFVLAPGAFASSKLLLRSGFKGAVPGVRTVGKRFSVNLGSALVARFETPQTGSDGQQIGYLIEVPEDLMVIETGFAPPSVFAMLAPQWGNSLMDIMKDYEKLAIAVPVLATRSYGEIKSFLGGSGFVIDYTMIDDDWRRLARGMKIAAKALFEAGASEVFNSRFDAKTCKSIDDLDDFFDSMGPQDYLKVESAHMQGGNVIHRSPKLGVVDNQMKVHGVSNLWIADASLIPAPVSLNIQTTVMALARYAAPFIAA